MKHCQTDMCFLDTCFALQSKDKEKKQKRFSNDNCEFDNILYPTNTADATVPVHNRWDLLFARVKRRLICLRSWTERSNLEAKHQT